MGLMDKFKNLFTDEEFEEEEEIEETVKIKQVKNEKPKKDKLPTFMREKIEKEEKEKKKKSETKDTEDIVSDFNINKELLSANKDLIVDKRDNENKKEEIGNNKFKFPVAFEESDFTDISRVSRQSRTEKNNGDSRKDTVPSVKLASKKALEKKEVKVAELYKDKREVEKKDEKRFTATPIISPIYGVLDKNYRKEELEPFSGGNYEADRPSKNIDFDSVRKKAYGSKKNNKEDNDDLVNDIEKNMMCENCEYMKKAKSCKKDVDDDLMYEALCEKNKEDDITLDEATENYYDYGVEYEKKNDDYGYDYDLLDQEEEEVKIVNHDDDVVDDEVKKSKKKKEVPPVKSSINLLSTLKKSMGSDEETDNQKEEKNLELTDDLFNLIDSMYDEGKDK